MSVTNISDVYEGDEVEWGCEYAGHDTDAYIMLIY